ncbi:hypothetical protein [Streptomyces sp. NPDC055085]
MASPEDPRIESFTKASQDFIKSLSPEQRKAFTDALVILTRGDPSKTHEVIEKTVKKLSIEVKSSNRPEVKSPEPAADDLSEENFITMLPLQHRSKAREMMSPKSPSAAMSPKSPRLLELRKDEVEKIIKENVRLLKLTDEPGQTTFFSLFRYRISSGPADVAVALKGTERFKPQELAGSIRRWPASTPRAQGKPRFEVEFLPDVHIYDNKDKAEIFKKFLETQKKINFPGEEKKSIEGQWCEIFNAQLRRAYAEIIAIKCELDAIQNNTSQRLEKLREIGLANEKLEALHGQNAVFAGDALSLEAFISRNMNTKPTANEKAMEQVGNTVTDHLNLAKDALRTARRNLEHFKRAATSALASLEEHVEKDERNALWIRSQGGRNDRPFLAWVILKRDAVPEECRLYADNGGNVFVAAAGEGGSAEVWHPDGLKRLRIEDLGAPRAPKMPPKGIKTWK